MVQIMLLVPCESFVRGQVLQSAPEFIIITYLLLTSYYSPHGGSGISYIFAPLYVSTLVIIKLGNYINSGLDLHVKVIIQGGSHLPCVVFS